MLVLYTKKTRFYKMKGNLTLIRRYFTLKYVYFGIKKGSMINYLNSGPSLTTSWAP